MARLSNFRRILEQDYPDDLELIRKLGIVLNSSFDELYSALNNRLTFRDNISSTISEIVVTVDASGTPKSKTSVKLVNQSVVEGVLVINATGESDTSLLPSSAVFVSFVKSEDTIIVNNIKGLQADKPYRIKLIILG